MANPPSNPATAQAPVTPDPAQPPPAKSGYRARSKGIDAIRFDGSNHDAIEDFLGRGEPIGWNQGRAEGRITGRRSTILWFRVGDWLVKGPDGGVDAYSPEEFAARHYEAGSGGE